MTATAHPLPYLNEPVFDQAVDRFYAAYGEARGRAFAVLPSEREEAHAEALDEALQAFLASYMDAAGCVRLPPAVRHYQTLCFAESWETYDALTAEDGWEEHDASSVGEPETRWKTAMLSVGHVSVHPPSDRDRADR